MRTTIRDVAREVSLSHTTVSRVLNGRGDIAIPEATRARVLAAAKSLGYRAHPAARALVTGRTHVVALWARDIYRPFFADVMVHVQSELRRDGYESIVHDLAGHEAAPGMDEAIGWPVDGILVLGGQGITQRYLSVADAEMPPLVSMGAYYTEAVDHVGLDLAPAVSQAMRHLLESGRERIAFVGSHMAEGGREGGPLPLDVRREVYASMMREAGREPEFLPLADAVHRGTRAQARRLADEYVRDKGLPQAFLCRNDDIAIGVYRALLDRGLSVPRDAAVVGCDNIEDAEYLEVPLSTIALPAQEMCSRAWSFLKARLAVPDLPRQSAVLPAQFVPRASSQRA